MGLAQFAGRERLDIAARAALLAGALQSSGSVKLAVDDDFSSTEIVGLASHSAPPRPGGAGWPLHGRAWRWFARPGRAVGHRMM